MEGIEVSDETLALETIAAVAPAGNFLSQQHTRKHMRDIFVPEFLDRRPYNEWESKRDGAAGWALNKARRILAEHEPQLLDPKLSRELESVVAACQVAA